MPFLAFSSLVLAIPLWWDGSGRPSFCLIAVYYELSAPEIPGALRGKTTGVANPGLVSYTMTRETIWDYYGSMMFQ
ncbi:MAG: hypothetical protein H6Q53_232 [Deltaproteobacteria bacterium]|nr:hypothetical protein [Deltaproteobacteria bacterium]